MQSIVTVFGILEPWRKIMYEYMYVWKINLDGIMIEWFTWA